MRKMVLEHLRHLELEGLRPGTIDARRRALTRLRAALPRPLPEATREDLLAWRASLHLAPKTIGCYISHARQFYDWLIEHGHYGCLGPNPLTGVPVPRPPRRLPRPIAEADLLAAVAGAPPRIRPWLVLAGWAGLRAIEIALLRRENVLDYAPRPVILIAADATKGRHERIVPMSAFVRAEIIPILPARGWMFSRADGAPGPNRPHTISHTANAYLHQMGITATLHQLRHRFGTQLYQQTKDLRLVQETMGHARPEDTAGYAAHDAASAAAAVEAIPAPGLHPVQEAS